MSNAIVDLSISSDHQKHMHSASRQKKTYRKRTLHKMHSFNNRQGLGIRQRNDCCNSLAISFFSHMYINGIIAKTMNADKQNQIQNDMFRLVIDELASLALCECNYQNASAFTKMQNCVYNV